MIEKLYNEFIKKPNERNFESLFQHLAEQIDSLDFNDTVIINACEIITKCLFRFKIGSWSEEQAKFAIKYLSRMFAKRLGLLENVSVSILTEEEYKKQNGDKSVARCTNNGDETFKVTCSPYVVEKLMSNKSREFIYGLQIIFHEVAHVAQNSILERDVINNLKSKDLYTYKTYVAALETVVRKADKEFYDKNYSNLSKEIGADKIGLTEAMNVIKKYSPKLYDSVDRNEYKKKIDEYIKKLEFTSSVVIYGKSNEDFVKGIDGLCTLYVKDHIEILDKYPILKIAYNIDGTKKSVIELIEERDKRLKEIDPSDTTTINKLNELYEFIANRKNYVTGGLGGTKKEIEDLAHYIQQNKTKDNFVTNLLIYRLKKSNVSEENINKLLDLLGCKNNDSIDSPSKNI